MTDILDDISDFVDDHGGWMLMGITVILSLLVLSIPVILFQPTKPYQVYGTVLGLEYHPSTSSTGVGTGMDSNGNSVVVVTSNSTSEEWVVVMQDNSGKVDTYQVNPQVFYSLDRGQRVKLNCVVGKWIPLISCL